MEQLSLFEQNIRAMLEEQQLKLGYEKSEVVRLYYPLVSLNHMLGVELSGEEMLHQLEIFANELSARYGKIKISSSKEFRYCVAIPPEGSAYVHEHIHENPFLKDLIEAIGRHGITVEEVFDVFYSYAKGATAEEKRANVHVEHVAHGEFDYLVYFKDGSDGGFRYCITCDENHVIYHRYTKTDYDDMNL